MMRDTLPRERWYHVLGVSEETGEDMVLTTKRGYEWASTMAMITRAKFPSAALALQTAHRIPGTRPYHNWTEEVTT